jgi:hypothetical protein
MKKIFLALSVVALVAFMAGPSSALVGMPDDVPGTDVLLPFFIVSIPGAPGARGDNSLATITEVKGIPGFLHWTIWDKRSRHVANGDQPYTPYDVVPFSLYDLVSTQVGAEGLEDLEVDLDGDGVVDHYMGYMTFENFVYKGGCVAGCDTKTRIYPDNLIGHTYVIDLLRGQTAGSTIPAREYAPRDAQPWDCEGWQYTQNTALELPYFGGVGYLPWPKFTDFEVYTGFALLTSKLREQGWCEWLPLVAEPLPETGEMIGVPSYFSLLPRYYLYDANASNHIFVYSSANLGQFFEGGQFDPDRYNVVIDIFDETEKWRSGQINLPWEVNFVDVRLILPSSWLAGEIGGWLNIRWEFVCLNGPTGGKEGIMNDYPWLYSAIPLATEWLAYSWQRADGPLPSLNWAVLFAAHRDVGTWTDLLCGLVDIPTDAE